MEAEGVVRTVKVLNSNSVVILGGLQLQVSTVHIKVVAVVIPDVGVHRRFFIPHPT